MSAPHQDLSFENALFSGAPLSGAQTGDPESDRTEHDGEPHIRLIDLMLSGCELHPLLAEAARTLNGAVQLRAPNGQVLAEVGEVPVIAESQIITASLDARSRRLPVMLPCGTWVAAAWSDHDDDLAMLIVRPAAPLRADGIRLLRLTAQAVTIRLLAERTSDIAEGQLRDELCEDLLMGCPPQSFGQVSKRIRRLGLDPDAPTVIVVARPEGGVHGRAAMWASSYARRSAGLTNTREDHLVFLLPGSDAADAARAISAELSSLLGRPVTTGAAGPVAGLAAVPSAYHEASRCLDVLALLGRTGCATTAKELGFLGLLLAEDRDVDGFIDHVLGALLTHDRQRGTELVRTLDAYFDAGQSPTNAAEQLHLHPNTISRRLARITELAGPDWRTPERAMQLQLALHLLRVRRALSR